MRLVEKPQERKAISRSRGVHVSPAVSTRSRPSAPDPRNELGSPTRSVPDRSRARGGRTSATVVKDTGKLEDMLEANRLIIDRTRDGGRSGNANRARASDVEAGGPRHRCGGPVIIGARARIVNAYVAPFTSIMNDAEVLASEIEHSIVLEGSSISNLGARIEDSLIGKNVRIYRLPVKPSAYRFMLGDNSEVGIRW